MKATNGNSLLIRLLKIGLITLVVYYSQVYPYVHFHHAHEDPAAAVETDTIPADDEHRRHVHHGHSHDHDSRPSGSSNNHDHDHEYSRHVDWHLVRSHSSSILTLIDYACISVQMDTGLEQNPPPARRVIESPQLPESVPLDGIDPRGPPTFG